MPALSALRRLLVAIPVLLITTLAVSLVSAPPANASLRAHKIHHGVKVGINQIGDLYAYGADGPNRFDCSGLVMYSFRKAGLYLPRTVAEQWRFVRHIRKSHLRRGDLVFFHDGGGVYHVAIFLRRKHGHVIILHSNHPGGGVHRAHTWTNSWWAGTLRPRS